MRTTRLLPIFGLLALALAAAVVLRAFASDPTPEPTATQIDSYFLMEMIPHHRAGVAMAQLAVQKATHQELKDMTQSIIDNQNREIDEMTRWLHDWYGMEPPTGTSMPMSDMLAMMRMMMQSGMPDMDMAMQQLQSKSDSDFEIAFMSDMIHHHGMAIMMTGPVLMAGEHAELYTLAENIAISQCQEVGQMDEWLQAWYGIDHPLGGSTLSSGMPMATSMPMPMASSVPMREPTDTVTPMPMDVRH